MNDSLIGLPFEQVTSRALDVEADKLMWKI